jgi:hypothetical protein
MSAPCLSRWMNSLTYWTLYISNGNQIQSKRQPQPRCGKNFPLDVISQQPQNVAAKCPDFDRSNRGFPGIQSRNQGRRTILLDFFRLRFGTSGTDTNFRSSNPRNTSLALHLRSRWELGRWTPVGSTHLFVGCAEQIGHLTLRERSSTLPVYRRIQFTF